MWKSTHLVVAAAGMSFIMLNAPSYAAVTFSNDNLAHGGDGNPSQTYSDYTEVLGEYGIRNSNSERYFPQAASFERLPPGFINREVPEPETWILTLVGFGIVGAAVRRRRVATS